jgi:hypothetical protein
MQELESRLNVSCNWKLFSIPSLIEIQAKWKPLGQIYILASKSMLDINNFEKLKFYK